MRQFIEKLQIDTETLFFSVQKALRDLETGWRSARRSLVQVFNEQSLKPQHALEWALNLQHSLRTGGQDEMNHHS